MIWILAALISAEFWLGVLVTSLALVVLCRLNVPGASAVVKAVLGVK